MFNRTGRSTLDNFMLGGVFVFLGGYGGVLTSIILGHFVNCMTGNSTEVGVSLGFVDFHEALLFLFILICFIFGAFLSTKLINKYVKGHVYSMFIQSMALFLVVVSTETSGLFLAALAMGLQNGMTTYTSWTEGGKIRSTHVTGTTTDIGVSIAEGDKLETSFTIFQALVYLTGAVIGFYSATAFKHTSFAILGIAVLLIAGYDVIKRTIKSL